MVKVFISYSRKDADFARKVATSLTIAGAEVWIDVEDIPPGMNWATAVQEGLRTCDALVLILSPDSMASPNVENEWQYFLAKRKAIFPILWRATEIHFQLINLNYLDFSAASRITYDQAFARLWLALNGARPSGLPTPPVTTPHTSQQEPLQPGTTTPAKPSKSVKARRRLEAAMPSETANRAKTEVRVKVSLPESEGLAGELPAEARSGQLIEKADVAPTTFNFEFRRNRAGDLLPGVCCIEVESDAFVVEVRPVERGGCPERMTELEIPPDADSRTVIIYLTARAEAEPGLTRVRINLYHKGRIVAQTVVTTTLLEERVVYRGAVEKEPAAVPAGGWTLGRTEVEIVAVDDEAPARLNPPSPQPLPPKPAAQPAPQPGSREEPPTQPEPDDLEATRPRTVPALPPAPAQSSGRGGRSILNEPLAIIVAAIITGVFTLSAALLGFTVSTDTPTVTVTATATPSETPAAPLSPTPGITPTDVTTSGSDLSLERSRDTVAVCTSRTGRLEIQIGTNERYGLNNLLQPVSGSAIPCACVQRDSDVNAPRVCTGENTQSQPAGADWQNQSITVFVDGTEVGSCAARPAEHAAFACELR